MSSIVRVISDLHLSHLNMAIKRGFKTSEQHDQHIIDQWNSVVKKRDVTWILGDITMEKSSPYYLLDRLNGIKNVVLGNHDRPKDVTKLLNHVNKVCSSYRRGKTMFTHIPIHPCELDRFPINVHGHLHEKHILDDRYVNVSCEVIDYTPVEINSYL